MAWNREAASVAIAGVLEAIDPAVPVFAVPPDTFNPPAYVCGVVETGDYNAAAFGVDRVQFRLYVSGGPNDYDRVSALAQAARKALEADPSLGGAVHHCRPATERNWRRLSIAGADVLSCDVMLEIQM